MSNTAILKRRTPQMCGTGACCSSGSRLRWRGLFVIATWASEQRATVDLEMVQNEICTMIAKLFNWRARATRTLRLPPLSFSLYLSEGDSVWSQRWVTDGAVGWRGWLEANRVEQADYWESQPHLAPLLLFLALSLALSESSSFLYFHVHSCLATLRLE